MICSEYSLIKTFIDTVACSQTKGPFRRGLHFLDFFFNIRPFSLDVYYTSCSLEYSYRFPQKKKTRLIILVDRSKELRGAFAELPNEFLLTSHAAFSGSTSASFNCLGVIPRVNSDPPKLEISLANLARYRTNRHRAMPIPLC